MDRGNVLAYRRYIGGGGVRNPAFEQQATDVGLAVSPITPKAKEHEMTLGEAQHGYTVED